MSEELKAQYERDVESGYPEPWTLWECNTDAVPLEVADKCATCRHTYEPKPPTIHVSMQFPDGRTYVADLPEPMREAPNEGTAFWLAETLGPKELIWGVHYDIFNWQHKFLALSLCHRTEAAAKAWAGFFKQWRSDK